MNSKPNPTLYLASTSPRRREILQALGIEFIQVAVAVDESAMEVELPERLVKRLAMAKADACSDGQIVLGADTVVVLSDRILGKPVDADDALEMLMALSGCTHKVYTGVALKSPSGTRSVVSATEVRFREIGQDEARLYWQSGEPCDKAGAYAIQGLGGQFIESIDGSYSGVVGLPVFETVELLRSAGIDVLAKHK